MSDRLHDYDYILGACAPGCAACAQTDADMKLSARAYYGSLLNLSSVERDAAHPESPRTGSSPEIVRAGAGCIVSPAI